MTRSTYTYASLEVSPGAYDEIRSKLEAAGYGHAFMEDGTIDMHGIGIVKPYEPKEGDVRAIVPKGRYFRYGLSRVLKMNW